MQTRTATDREMWSTRRRGRWVGVAAAGLALLGPATWSTAGAIGDPATPDAGPWAWANVNAAGARSGGTGTAAHLGIGRYRVTFGALGSATGASTAAVSTFDAGASGRFCKLGSWAGAAVDVRCFSAAGAPTDSGFSVLLSYDRQLRDDFNPPIWNAEYGFAVMGRPAGATSTPAPTQSFNSRGRPNTFTRISAGEYAMTFGGLTVAGGRRSVMLTALGTDSVACVVRSLGTTAAGAVARVGCFRPSGAAVDTRFAVQSFRRNLVSSSGTEGEVAWIGANGTSSYSSATNSPTAYCWFVTGASARTGVGRSTLRYTQGMPDDCAFDTSRAWFTVPIVASGSARCAKTAEGATPVVATVRLGCTTAGGAAKDTALMVFGLG